MLGRLLLLLLLPLYLSIRKKEGGKVVAKETDEMEGQRETFDEEAPLLLLLLAYSTL